MNLSITRAEEMYDNSVGICVCCGHEQDGVEADADGYDCEVCGQPHVVGIGVALDMM